MRERTVLVLSLVLVSAAVVIGAVELSGLVQRMIPSAGTTGPQATATAIPAHEFMPSSCPPVMWQWGQPRQSGLQRITLSQASEIIDNYISTRLGPGFKVHEIMEFENNFYVIVMEEETGIGALELLVDPYTGIVSLEPGPNMMWNRKYGMHYAMMGVSVEPASEMPIKPEQARELALRYLSQRYSGEIEVLKPMVFYGYYTFDYKLDGKIHGMLSVNGYSGDVWYHAWHGGFIQELEFNGEER